MYVSLMCDASDVSESLKLFLTVCQTQRLLTQQLMSRKYKHNKQVCTDIYFGHLDVASFPQLLHRDDVSLTVSP